MKRIVTLFLFAFAINGQTSWDLSDYFGVPTVKQPVELPYTAGIAPKSSKRVIGPYGEIPWQQISDGSILIMQAARKASRTSRFYQNWQTALNTECAPDGRFLWGDFGFAGPDPGDMLIPRAFGGGAVSTNLTAGNVYHVVSKIDCDGFTEGFTVSATPGGSPITITNRGTDPWDWTYTAAIWDGGDGLRIHADYTDGQAVRIRCGDSCTLPTGLSAGTTYYLDFISTDIYDVYSDAALTSQVSVTGSGSGPNEILSWWGYTLEDTASSSPAITNPVVIAQNGDYWEITNGLTGVRIPRVNSSCDRAPIQGIQLDTGSWTAAANPNYLYYDAIPTYPQTTQAVGIDSCTLYWLERGPLVTHGRIEYTDTGVGYFNVDFWLYANFKSIIIEYDTTLNVSQYLQLPSAIDTIRLSKNSLTGTSWPDDTEETLTTAKDYRLTAWEIFTLSCTDPCPITHGILYEAAGGGTTPAIGLYGGRGWVDRQFQTGNSYVRHITFETSHPATGGAGAYFSFGYNDSPNSPGHITRRFAIYVGTKADVPASLSTVSDIGLTNFGWATAPSLTDLQSPQYANPPDPAGGWGYPYRADDSMVTAVQGMDTGTYDALISTLSGNQTDWDGRDIARAWRINDAASTRGMLWWAHPNFFQMIRDLYLHCGTCWIVPGAGIAYYFESVNRVTTLSAGLIAALQSANTPSWSKEDARKMLGFYSGWLWDDNWAPVDNDVDNMGLQNQLDQAIAQRSIISNLSRTKPFLTSRHVSTNQFIKSSIMETWYNRYGESSGVVHNGPDYISTATEWVKAWLLSKLSNGYPMNDRETILLTKQVSQEFALEVPPDPRFSSAGTRTTSLFNDTGFGQIPRYASSAVIVNSETSKYHWVNDQNKAKLETTRLPAFFLYDYLDLTDQTAPSTVSLLMYRYMASMRSDYGTSNETMVSHLIGPAIDHMHLEQDGSVMLYALKAPVSTMYANRYAPRIGDRRLSNNLMMDSEATWTLDSQPLEGVMETRFGTNPTGTGYFSGSKVQWSQTQQQRTSGPLWTRTARLMMFNPAYPIISVRDTFSGTDAGAYKVFSWNQAAVGAVDAPGGSYTPTVRDYTVDSSLPSNGTVVALTANALNHFGFVGQGWNHNPSGIIDWDFYSVPGGTTPEFLIGNWCNNLQAASILLAAYGANPKQCQHILRMRSNGAMQSIWLPYRKAESPSRTVTLESCGVQIVQGSETTCWDDDKVTYTDGTVNTLATFGSASASYADMTISGGPAECVKASAGSITCRVDGIATGSTRTITLPSGTWYADVPVVSSAGNVFVVHHPGGTFAQTYTIAFSTTPVARTATGFQFNPPAGTSTLRMAVGDTTRFNGSVACSSPCSITWQLPSGSQDYRWEYVDAGGAVVASSNIHQVVVP